MRAVPPPLRFPDPVRRDLDAHRSGLADETERMMAALARPCVAITARRVTEAPLRRNAVARLFGAQPAAAVLGVTDSKFGGVPYCETEEDWTGVEFLGQIDLAEATAVLPQDAPRLTGLLRLDRAERVRVRWFPRPSADRCVAAAPRSAGAWEARLHFDLAWTLPDGEALEAIWPLRKPPLHEYEEVFPGYNADASDDFHRMLGHKSVGLDEHDGFTPPPQCTDDLASYECLLRLTFDNAAGFHWGSNWVYLLVPREDLVRGDLSRIVVTGANS